MSQDATFKDLLAASPFATPWQRLRTEVVSWESSAFATRYLHIDHGLHHWKFVLKKAESLWRLASAAETAWWSADYAFLLSAAAYLHDAAMFFGYQYLKALPEHCCNVIGPYLASFAADPRQANDALAFFLVRNNQGLLAAEVVRSLASEGRPLANLERSLIDRLTFLVTHYDSLDAGKAKRIASTLTPSDRRGLLAAASVLQVSDWAHLDRNRVLLTELQRAVQESERLVAQIQQEPNPPEIPADAGVVGMLPTLFRSHYVAYHSMKISTNPSPSVSFSTRIYKPLNLSPAAESELLSEWRSKLLPSRLRSRIAYDFLLDYCRIFLRYTEPRAEPLPRSSRLTGRNAYIPVPGIVHDYWVARRWFNLEEDWLTLVDLNMLIANPYAELKLPVRQNDVYSAYLGDLTRKHSPLPRLSRRLLLLIHTRVTRGDPHVGEMFFRALHHSLYCPCCHKKKALSYGDCFQYALDYTKRECCTGLLKSLGISEDELGSQSFLAQLSKALQERRSLRPKSIKDRFPQMKTTAATIIRSLTQSGILAHRRGYLSLNTHHPMAIQFRIYGDSFTAAV